MQVNPIPFPVLIHRNRLTPFISKARCLLEWVGVGSPPGEEERETDGLENAGQCTNGNSVKRALLSGDLGNELYKG